MTRGFDSAEHQNHQARNKARQTEIALNLEVREEDGLAEIQTTHTGSYQLSPREFFAGPDTRSISIPEGSLHLAPKISIPVGIIARSAGLNPRMRVIPRETIRKGSPIPEGSQRGPNGCGRPWDQSSPLRPLRGRILLGIRFRGCRQALRALLNPRLRAMIPPGSRGSELHTTSGQPFPDARQWRGIKPS